jgi:hypothetical protein
VKLRLLPKHLIDLFSCNTRQVPENFDLKHVGQKPKPKARTLGPKSPFVTPPGALERNKNPTEQKNELMLQDSIFGVDVTVVPIQPRENFSTSIAQLPLIAAETYAQCSVDERQIDRVLAKEEMSYYATCLLWTKLIDVKAKQGRETLTTEERAIRKATEEVEFNVPQPIAVYLGQIGQYTDKMGKTTDLQIPHLPTARVQGMGGYHAPEIREDTHYLFEEVPSLGIAADMVMSLTQEAQEPEPNFRMERPDGTVLNNNLMGRFYPVGPRRPEIKQRLAGQGITPNVFPQYVRHTRFNLRYMKSISDIVGSFNTFRNERMCFPRLSISGGETQVIVTRPTPGEDQHETWTTRSVQATSAADSSTAIMGGSFMFGFQLYKEPGEGQTPSERHAKWCCLSPTLQQPWQIPEGWIENRNLRRNLPPGIGTERFRTLSKRQDLSREDIIRRMVKTTH